MIKYPSKSWGKRQNSEKYKSDLGFFTRKHNTRRHTINTTTMNGKNVNWYNRNAKNADHILKYQASIRTSGNERAELPEVLGIKVKNSTNAKVGERYSDSGNCRRRRRKGRTEKFLKS